MFDCLPGPVCWPLPTLPALMRLICICILIVKDICILIVKDICILIVKGICILVVKGICDPLASVFH